MSRKWCVSFVFNIVAVAVESQPEGVACLSNVLFVAPGTCDEVYDVV